MTGGHPAAPTPRRFGDAGELSAAIGQHLGYSDWVRVDQKLVDTFAAATGDHQWIHVDPARAAHGPFGSTIAHGYLTLSLVPALLGSLVEYTGWPVKINYGSNKVRFVTPVVVGSRLRAGAELLDVNPRPAGIHVTVRVTVEIEEPDGVLAAKPALVAETITLLVS
ncbi:MAG: MaoC family dehydratase [Nocardioidaceae bacterium]